jgi:arsenite methyltransferase
MNNDPKKPDDLKRLVRDSYGRIAQEGGGCAESSCCTPVAALDPCAQGTLIGYSPEQMQSMDGANLGLGCGNPIDRAGLASGETVLDLGSGPGFDALLAAERVGPQGRVIGVDMTSEMIDRARENARSRGADNVEFRLGEIEHLPMDDGCVDVVISNCVINLSPDKEAVYRDVFRVLKPGGRVCISDVLLQQDVPDALKADPAAWCG